MSSTKPVLQFVMLLVTCIGMLVGQVYGEPTPLNGTEGKNITLPDKVMKSGTLRGGGKTYLHVVDGTIDHILVDRVLWNSSTGNITIINLQTNDTGELTLSRKNSSIKYNLTVHATPPGTPTGTPTATPTATPTGNKLWWLLLLLVLVLAGPAYHFGRKAVEFCRQRPNREPAPGNGNEENHPMMPLRDRAAENPV